jgi:hypothetical protein
MRARRAMALSICACASVWPWCAAPAADTVPDTATAAQLSVAEVAAEAPVGLAVTVYRAPERRQGSFELNALDGFALISETRMVRLPAGLSRLRFDGVADGIEAQSAIITGLPEGIIEKNRDAKVLSPSALVASTAGKSVELLRTNRKTGKFERIAGKILSDAGGGVVFSTADGIEALRCSGLAESFEFQPQGVPAARPSLSVVVRTHAAVTGKVTLSYLSRGFDWAADYSATLAPDERSMDLGAWVTLANSNGTGFPSASTQVVAGRVNRERGNVEPVDLGGPILARCWPRGSTSDSPPRAMILAQSAANRGMKREMMLAAPAAMSDVAVSALRKVELEQLGDLKLYRIPEPTTVASRQSKQVRLLDRTEIPVTMLYRVELSADQAQTSFAAERLLRTDNDKASHLGLPLPSGSIAVFSLHGGERLLLHESSLRDLAVNEQVEIGLGASSDVQVAVVHEKVSVDSTQAQLLPLLPGVNLRSVGRGQLERVQISNARAEPIHMELRVALDDGAQLIRADQPPGSRNGLPMFSLTVPAQATSVLRYEIQFKTRSVVR